MQVGPRASGKTSLVRLAAQLTGHRLDILNTNSAMDTTELLGGFEQVRTTIHLFHLACRLCRVVLSRLCQGFRQKEIFISRTNLEECPRLPFDVSNKVFSLCSSLIESALRNEANSIVKHQRQNSLVNLI